MKIDEDSGRYKVIRITQSGKKRTIYKNLSLAEAQRICRDPATSSHGKLPFGRNWFYGYDQQ